MADNNNTRTAGDETGAPTIEYEIHDDDDADGETKHDDDSEIKVSIAKPSSEGNLEHASATSPSIHEFPNDAKIVKEAKRLAKKVDMEEKSFKAIVSLLYKRLHLHRDDKPRLMKKKKLIVSAMKEASTSAAKKTTNKHHTKHHHSHSKTPKMPLSKPEDVPKAAILEEEEEKKEEEKEPDYLDANFVPKTSEEYMAMVVARARKEAEEEAEQHRKLLEVARLNAQADMELKKAEALAKLRKQTQEREQKEQMRERFGRNPSNKQNDYFADVKSMNAQLLERSQEYKASMMEQERQGLIILRPREDVWEQQQRITSVSTE
ncbi:MAG: hypothetical protein SGBAC_012337 [Bacillariaceae sp.]